MKTEMKYVYAIAVTAVAMLFTPLSGRADPPSDLVRLSENLENIVGELDGEFREHYGNSQGYRTLTGYLRGIEARGVIVHRLAKSRGVSAQVIQRELAVISQLNNNMRGLINQLENQAGRYVLRLFGDTRDVHLELGNLSRNIQGMQRAASSYGVGTRYAPQYSYPNQLGYRNNYNQPAYNYPNQQPVRRNYNRPAYNYPNQQQRTPNHNQPAYSYPTQPHRTTPQPAVAHPRTGPLQKLQQTRQRIKSALFGRH